MNIELIKQPCRTFRWKDRKNNFHLPGEMPTRHVFMSLIMIWNHTMPADAVITQSGNWLHHTYNIGSFYDKDYLCIAIGALGRELSTRTDLEPAWNITLDKMQKYLFKQYQITL